MTITKKGEVWIKYQFGGITSGLILRTGYLVQNL